VNDGRWTEQKIGPPTSPAFDAVIKILRCQAAVVITDQSDTPVTLDMFDVFQ